MRLGKQKITGKKNKDKIRVEGSDINKAVLLDMTNYCFIVIIILF